MRDDLTERLVEAIAGWRVRMPDARAHLFETATDLLAAGDSHPSVAELASAYPDQSGVEIDAIVERVTDELDMRGALSHDIETTAARRICRLVLEGDMSERNAALWAYEQFQNQSESELINDLAYLDDDYVHFEHSKTKTDSLDSRVREIASELLNGKN